MSNATDKTKADKYTCLKYVKLVRVIHDDMPCDMGACEVRLTTNKHDNILAQVNYILRCDSGELCVLERFTDIANDTSGCFTKEELEDVTACLLKEPDILSDIKSIRHSMGFKETISSDGRLYPKSVNMIEWLNEEGEVTVYYDEAIGVNKYGRVIYKPAQDTVCIDEFLNSDRYVYITDVYWEAKLRSRVMNRKHYRSDTINGVFITFEEGI